MTRTGEERVWTVPNVITGLRLLGVVPLASLGWHGERTLFLGLLALMLLSDWLDGKVAAALDQRTELGPQLDSVSDALMYGALGLSFWWLEPTVIRGEMAWLVGALASWVLSVVVALARFGRLPSYHTRAAKIGWGVLGGTALYTIWSGDGRAVPWALAWVVLANAEAVAISFVLPEWRSDLSSLLQAMRTRVSADTPKADADEGAGEEPEHGGA